MMRVEAQAILGGLAADQYGLVTSAQAGARGVDGVTLLRLRDAGLLELVGRGVYQVTGAVTPTHLEMRVAWLRLDPARPAWERDGLGARDGVVSHRSACVVHGLGDIPAPTVELTIAHRMTTREPRVVLHLRSGGLHRRDTEIVDGLPVTTAERTIVDLLRDGADAGHIGGVIADAEHRGLVDLDALAGRAAPLAERYGMAGASGTELIASLTADAGQRLSANVVLEAIQKAAAAGYEGGVLQGLGIQNAAAMLSMLETPQLASNSVAAVWHKAIADLVPKTTPSPGVVAGFARAARLGDPVNSEDDEGEGEDEP
jgi:hypothetical protein